MQREKVILAMSGGVDSSVAAYLLKQKGYEVIGVFMRLGMAEQTQDACASGACDCSSQASAGRAGHEGCCSAEAAQDARRVAGVLGIPFYVLNFAADFDAVIDYFAAEYARGRTPNPCAMCNQFLKFGKLVDYADAMGARYVATGHHARVALAQDGRPAILRARSVAKDQSYVLFGLPAELLGRVLLPIGEYDDKAIVRHIARQMDLSVADKPDSQEICFVPGGDYTTILRQRAAEAMRPGPIVDMQGREVGRHEGIGHFTIGQRRGLRVSADEPLYVVRIDAATATVTIGPRQATMSQHLTASGANWHADIGQGPRQAIVQIRYNNRGSQAIVQPLEGGRFEVTFAEPVHAITPGQIAAVYDGDRLLGGGWIEDGIADFRFPIAD